jgi:ribosomal protein S27AE
MLIQKIFLNNVRNFLNFFKKASEKNSNKINLISLKFYNFRINNNESNNYYKKIFFWLTNFSKLDGGGKKRKKKNYTKPKKTKHLRKKIKLRVLNYYSIKEGKIIKVRKESPQSSGSFMAEHYDRFTCGKTGLTLIRTL